MQTLQVIERGLSGIDDVAPAVIPAVLLEAEDLASTGDELPDASRVATRQRLWVVCGFDDWQEGDFHGHMAFIHCLNDMEQVEAGAVQGSR